MSRRKVENRECHEAANRNIGAAGRPFGSIVTPKVHEKKRVAGRRQNWDKRQFKTSMATGISHRDISRLAGFSQLPRGAAVRRSPRTNGMAKHAADIRMRPDDECDKSSGFVDIGGYGMRCETGEIVSTLNPNQNGLKYFLHILLYTSLKETAR